MTELGYRLRGPAPHEPPEQLKQDGCQERETQDDRHLSSLLGDAETDRASGLGGGYRPSGALRTVVERRLEPDFLLEAHCQRSLRYVCLSLEP